MKRIGRRQPPRLYIKEWIEYLDLDQKRVAERMDCKEGTVSKLLNGHMAMTMEWLAGFHEALAWSKDDITIQDLYRDPLRPTQQELLSKLPPEKRKQAEDYISFLASTGTDNS